jgi:hypothetical protein
MSLNSILIQNLIAKVYLSILIIMFIPLSFAYSNSLATIASNAQYTLQINETNIDFFIGPTFDYRYTKQSAPLLEKKVNVSINETFIGLTGGVSVSRHRWINSLFISIESGKGRVNLKSDNPLDQPINAASNVNHYFFSSAISTGYKFGNNEINSTTSAFIEYDYSNYKSTQAILLYEIRVNKLSQTDNSITVGVSQNTNWVINDPLSISVNIGIGYTLFHNSSTTFDSIFLTVNDKQHSNSGISASLSAAGIYDTSYGRFILAPWVIYSKILGRENILDTSTLMAGLKLAYLF